MNEAHRKRLNSLRSSRSFLPKRFLKRAVNEERKQFFNRIDNDGIRQTKRDIPVIHNPSILIYALAG